MLILCLKGINAFGWSGAGTESDPYQIATAADLATLATNCNNGNSYRGVYFKMINNISLTGYAWVPIGTSGFRGDFNGNNMTVSGLSCNDNYYWANAGLFGVIGSNARILNLTISGCSVSGYAYVGGLAGRIDCVDSGIEIQNCHVSGTISGNCAGGLIGWVENVFATTGGALLRIRYCSSTATVTGGPDYGMAGGLIGMMEGVSTENDNGRLYLQYCYSSGPVSGPGITGGLIGSENNCVIENCYSRSTITAPANEQQSGGFAGAIGGGGFYPGKIIRSFSTGSGTAKVKHELAGNRWWYIGSPMTNATASSFGTLSPAPNTGTPLFSWNEPGNAYVNITDGSAALSPLKGYSYKNFTGADTAVFTGALNTGLIGSDNNLSYTAGGSSAGFNLVCNPFPSAINWGSPSNPAAGITRTGIDPTIWYRTNSTYSTYNTTSGTGTGSPAGQQYIPAMQAFWVKVSDTLTGHGTLKIGNGARVHHSQPFYKSSGESNIFRFFVSRDSLQDDIAVGFYEQAQPGFDPYDSEKRFNDADYPHLYTLTSDNHVVVINGQPLMLNQDPLTIPLGFGTAVEGLFTLEATTMNEFAPGLSVMLIDKQGGIRQDLREHPVYTFQSDVVYPNPDRISLYFSKKGAATTELTDQPAVHIFSARNTLYIDMLAGGGATAVLYNMLGQKVLSRHVEPGLNQIEVNCPGGFYIVRVQKGEQLVSQKLMLGR